jgi:bifunctional DNase/RNase
MIPIQIQTLIVSNAPTPSIIVLQPVEDVKEGENARIIPIWVGINEATQMGIALEKARFSRPMTHDLFLDALTNLGARVDHVLIHDVDEATFFAKLVLSYQNHLIELDARPSDALALGLRQGAPLYIEEAVLEKASFPYMFKKNANAEEEVAEFHKFVEGLAPEDFEL